MLSDDKKIKVCFISPKGYPLFDPEIKAVFGGAEVDLYYVATELAKDKDFEVSCITADYGQESSKEIEGVNVVKSFRWGQNPLVSAKKIWDSLHKVNADIYIIKSVSLGIYLVSLYCRIKEKTFVYRTAHSTHCDGTYLVKHPFMGYFFKRTLRKAYRILVQNEQDSADIKRTAGIESVVIKNGHRLLSNYQPIRDKIVWVGRSAGFKCPHLFIELSRQFPEHQFTMICQKAFGDRNYEGLVNQSVQIDNLEFIERVPFRDIDKYYRTAKILVNTSDSEGFPNTFIQACKAATPILSLKVNPDGFLDKYECGICAKGDWQSFIDGLKLLLNPDMIEKYGHNGLEYVKQNHDITKIVEDYKRLLKEL